MTIETLNKLLDAMTDLSAINVRLKDEELTLVLLDLSSIMIEELKAYVPGKLETALTEPGQCWQCGPYKIFNTAEPQNQDPCRYIPTVWSEAAGGWLSTLRYVDNTEKVEGTDLLDYTHTETKSDGK